MGSWFGTTRTMSEVAVDISEDEWNVVIREEHPRKEPYTTVPEVRNDLIDVIEGDLFSYRMVDVFHLYKLWLKCLHLQSAYDGAQSNLGYRPKLFARRSLHEYHGP